MTAVSDNMPGWFKRRRAAAAESTSGGASGNIEGGTVNDMPANGTAASTKTGGGSSHEPVVVWEAANLMEAQVVKGRLESEGIPAFIRSEAAGVIYGITAGSLARADVLVPGPLADKAVAILFDDDADDEYVDEYVDESDDEAGDVSSDDYDEQRGDQGRGQAER
jgi:hypothetical protein